MQPTQATQRAERRARLEGWIADTQRRQRRFALIAVVGGALGAAAFLVDRTSGLIALVGTAVLVGVSFWVTGSHLTGWRAELARLDGDPPA